MSLLRHGKAQALTIYLGEADQWHGQPAYVAVLQLLREQHGAGATVTRALAGYGAGEHLHEQRIWEWTSDAPLMIQVIDQPERLQRLLPQIQEMLSGGLITLHDVEVVAYTHARPHGLPATLSVQRVMETSLVTASPGTPVAEVMMLLLDAPFRVLPIVDPQQHLLGIISTGDLIRADVLPVRRSIVRTALEFGEATAQEVAHPLEAARRSQQTAQDIMNRQVQTVQPATSVREAARIMLETGLRRLPVVEPDGTLRGMITRADLLQVAVTTPLARTTSSATHPLEGRPRISGPLAQQISIAEYMQPVAAVVQEQASLGEVMDVLQLSPFRRVVVVDTEQRVSGIISDVDLLARIQEDARPWLLRVLGHWSQRRPGHLPHPPSQHAGKARVAADVMNRDVVTVTDTISVQETITRMLATGRKALPVVDQQRHLKGIVGRSDLLQVLVEG